MHYILLFLPLWHETPCSLTGIKKGIEINMFIVDPQVFVTSSCLHIHHIFANCLLQMKSVMCHAGHKIQQKRFDSREL